MKNTTLCYIEKDGAYLMMHRTKKKNDANRDKWIGIGGHMEPGESPFDCIRREVKEETGLILEHPFYRGLVSFCSDAYETEYMHLFSADTFSGELRRDCEEGELAWLPKETLLSLPMWEGDRIFLRLLDEEVPFFSLKLSYLGDTLVSHTLDFCGARTAQRPKEPLLLSACLLGLPCRYDGKTKPLSEEILLRLKERYTLIPVCAEVLGGLPTPRIPAECQRDPDGKTRVVRRDGVDVTAEYLRGADAVLAAARINDCKKALLKARSPSCGMGMIYDGTHSGTLTQGNGTTAAHLLKNGISVTTEEAWETLL